MVLTSAGNEYHVFLGTQRGSILLLDIRHGDPLASVFFLLSEITLVIVFKQLYLFEVQPCGITL
jgi:hypothetical protein